VIISWEEWYSGQGVLFAEWCEGVEFEVSNRWCKGGRGGFQLAGGKVCYHFGSITNLWTHIIY